MARPGQERSSAKDGFTDQDSKQPGRTHSLEGWRHKATEVRLVVQALRLVTQDWDRSLPETKARQGELEITPPFPSYPADQ